jgi:hypothetical protein
MQFYEDTLFMVIDWENYNGEDGGGGLKTVSAEEFSHFLDERAAASGDERVLCFIEWDAGCRVVSEHYLP